ncbi:MAG: hypothetical protein GX937_08685 [Lentisphaerae bacterium]|jgi:YbbR domain-containing protein|nr:hypothetical protein [Lentisphaerota bacterium]
MNVAKKPKRTFFTDFWRKVVALLLAVMVWVMVDMQMQVTSTVQQVKLKIRYDDSKFYLRRSEFDVDLEVATSAKLSQLSAEQFLLEVDFPESQLNPGQYTINLKRLRSIVTRKPLGVRVKAILPQTLTVPFDVIKKRQVKVLPQITGHLPEGYEQSCTCDPAEVEVTGPSLLVQGITQVVTEEQPLSPNALAPFSTMLQVLSPAPGVIDVQPEKIRVEVRIEDMRRMTTRTISRQLSGVLLPVSGSLVLTSLPASDVKIVVGGQYRSVNNLKEDRLRVIADVTGATGPGQFRAKVLVMDLPLGVTLDDVEPNELEVVLMGAPSEASPPNGTALKKGDNNQGQDNGGAPATPQK